MAIQQFAPINYAGMMPQEDLTQSIMQGLQIGAMLRQQREASQAKQAAQEQAKQYSADVQAAFASGRPEAFAALAAKYPQQREAFKQSWDTLNDAQRETEFIQGVQAYGALRSGRIDDARAMLEQQIAAQTNAGKDTQRLQALRQALDTQPELVQNNLGLALSAIDPDKWSKLTTELRAAEKAPAELTEAQARAQKAATDAKFAESNAVLDLQKKGWDITRLQQDIDINRENTRIAALRANLERESNDLKRQELQQKLDEAKVKRDEAVLIKAADLESGRASIDNMLGTIARARNTSESDIKDATGVLQSRMLTMRQGVADFEELINTLSSQAFIAQIPSIRGTGALSDAEGKKLQAALQNLSLRQSPQRLMDNINEAERLLMKSRTNLAKRSGLPDVAPDITPLAAGQPQVRLYQIVDGYRYMGGDPAKPESWRKESK